MKTNRQWLESLTDKQLSEFFTHGIMVKTCYLDCPPFPLSIHQIAGSYMQATQGVERWLSIQQSYEVVED